MTTTPWSSSSLKRLIISENLVLLILGLAGLAYVYLDSQKPAVQEKPTVSPQLNVDVYTVESINFQEVLSGFGTVRADREVILAAQVSGEITEVHPQLEVGYHVAAGKRLTTPAGPSEQRAADQLLKIDPRDYEQRVEQAVNRIAELNTEIDQLNVQKTNVARQVAKGESVLKTLTEEKDRLKAAVERNVGTPSDLNKALLEVQRYADTLIQLESQAASIPHQIIAAKQRLATSKSEKQRAENDLQRADVMPPFDGVLSEVFVEQGQYVQAGEPLVRLTDLSVVEIPVALSFDDFLQLEQEMKNGHRPAVTVAENESVNNQSEERTWKGYVVRTSPEADPGSRTVQVFVEVRNTDETRPLLPGTFVHARIDGRRYKDEEEVDDVFLIPRECVVDESVYVVNEKDKVDVARHQIVRLRQHYRSLVEVTDGVEPGDRLALTNLDILQNRFGRSEDQTVEVSVQSSTTIAEEIKPLVNTVIKPLNGIVNRRPESTPR
ncbi:MAG: efflux RND transporter periplasmic adaptor subunit [Fuerstiella sp.]|nr:efflux RND transporter periplasmic adaptor subunit [Fuerstiella sp.]MCP4509189.1 efflux RND transporter periplasmic adaptor subunit [Fuerstiella sp.]MDG2129535.1 efflux RND transporter periplasmic adaptor subunit [Fuerstiella sp.]